MAVSLIPSWERGWKKQDFNNPVLILNFVDSSHGFILFKYAPKLTDDKIFKELFLELQAHERQKQSHQKSCKEIQK